jgi:hypothetical protein
MVFLHLPVKQAQRPGSRQKKIDRQEDGNFYTAEKDLDTVLSLNNEVDIAFLKTHIIRSRG